MNNFYMNVEASFLRKSFVAGAARKVFDLLMDCLCVQLKIRFTTKLCVTELTLKFLDPFMNSSVVNFEFSSFSKSFFANVALKDFNVVQDHFCLLFKTLVISKSLIAQMILDALMDCSLMNFQC